MSPITPTGAAIGALPVSTAPRDQLLAEGWLVQGTDGVLHLVPEHPRTAWLADQIWREVQSYTHVIEAVQARLRAQFADDADDAYADASLAFEVDTRMRVLQHRAALILAVLVAMGLIGMAMRHAAGRLELHIGPHWLRIGDQRVLWDDVIELHVTGHSLRCVTHHEVLTIGGIDLSSHQAQRLQAAVQPLVDRASAERNPQAERAMQALLSAQPAGR